MSIADTQANAIAARGIAVTLKHAAPGAYNPATGKPTTSVTTWSGKGLPSAVKAASINGTSIQNGDRRIRVMNPGFEPVPNDVLMIGAVSWNISSVEPTYDGGLPVSYLLLIRK